MVNTVKQAIITSADRNLAAAAKKEADQPESEQGRRGRLGDQKTEGVDVTIGGFSPTDDVAAIVYRGRSALTPTLSAPLGTPDSPHSIPRALVHATRPGTSPDARRTLTVAMRPAMPGHWRSTGTETLSRHWMSRLAMRSLH